MIKKGMNNEKSIHFVLNIDVKRLNTNQTSSYIDGLPVGTRN